MVDLGPQQARLPWGSSTSSLLVYGLVTFSVTLAVTDSEQPPQILLVLLGNALAIWIAHAFAETTVHDQSPIMGLSHAAPMLAGAAPSGLVLLVGWGRDWSGEDSVILAEALNLLALVTLQVIHPRRTLRAG